MSENRTKKRSAQKVIVNILICLLLAVAAFCGYKVIPWFINDMKEKRAIEAIHEEVHETVQQSSAEDADSNTFRFTKEAWDKLHSLNNDFVAYMAFDDEYVSEPIVQTTNNDYYLHYWIDRTWGNSGTVFIDAMNDLSDQNITLYGHNVFYPGGEKRKMTPMVKLLDQAEYEKHSEFNVWFKDYMCRYRITNIYYWDADTESDIFDFRERDLSDVDNFNRYTSFINSRNEIKCFDQLRYGDRFISIQTCRDLTSEVRIIFTCKEIKREQY